MAKTDYDKMTAKERAFALFTACEEARRGGYDGKKGHDAALACWNAWAEPLLAEREKLEADGEWAVEFGYDRELSIWTEAGTNDKSRDFLTRANINVSYFTFAQRGWRHTDKNEGEKEGACQTVETDKTIDCIETNLSYFVFPGNAYFDKSIFKGIAYFIDVKFKGYVCFRHTTFEEGAEFGGAAFEGKTYFRRAIFIEEAHFSGATFKGNAYVNKVTFKGDAYFDNVAFRSDAYFDYVLFEDNTYFIGATFKIKAGFRKTIFKGYANFIEATFSGYTYFNEATFSGYTYFNEATFKGDADFAQATCESHADFSQAEFLAASNFTALHSSRAFNLAGVTFNAQVPQFTQAHFTESPRLDHLNLPMVAPFSGRLPPAKAGEKGKKVDQDDVAAFTALRRLALKGEDHETERMAFKGEMRSLRAVMGWQNRWYFPSLIYDLFTDFGASVLKPTLLWAALFAVMMVYYLPAPDVERPENCGSPYEHAALLSLHNGLLFATAGQRPFVLKAYHCLYGKKGDAPKDVVLPDRLGLWGTLQTSLSAILIFFILLALRNRFKIK